MTSWVPPGLILIVGALLIPLLKGRIKQIYVLLLPLITIYNVALMEHGTYYTYQFLGHQLTLAYVDELSMVFGIVFSIFAFMAGLYSLHTGHNGHFVASYIYAGSSLGATFAGDYITLTIFWELMLPASLLLIWYRKRNESIKAGYRYAAFHALGGAILMTGVALTAAQGHDLTITHHELELAHLTFQNLPAFLILLGIMVNAAVPPLHAWVPDAYPRSTIVGGVFLCAFTTKTAVYALLRGFAGTEILVWFGAIMAVYGVVFAAMENRIRGILSYHIVSQVGYMVAGAGIGTALAVNGSSAHAFTHILYKGLLFMATGAVIYTTGKERLTDLGGLHKKLRPIMILYMIGALSISATPLFSGFISKSMITAAASEEHLVIPWILMMLASVGTFLSVGLKLPYFTFFSTKPTNPIEPKKLPLNMTAAMILAAAANILLGIYPNALYTYLPHHVEFVPYTVEHLIEMLLIIFTTAIAFFWTRKLMKTHRTIPLDLDWTYRKGYRLFMWGVNNPVTRVFTAMERTLHLSVLAVIETARTTYGFDKTIVDGTVNYVPEHFIKRPSFTARKFDNNVVDGIVDWINIEALEFGDLSARITSGYVQNYIALFALGLTLLILATELGRWIL